MLALVDLCVFVSGSPLLKHVSAKTFARVKYETVLICFCTEVNNTIVMMIQLATRKYFENDLINSNCYLLSCYRSLELASVFIIIL